MAEMTGKQLRKLRLAQGVSTDKAAKLVGVSRRSWVRWETLPSVPKPMAKFVGMLWQPGAPREPKK